MVGEGSAAMVDMGRVLACVTLCIGLLMSGCAADAPVGLWDGPATPAASTAKDWRVGEQKGKVLESAHYRLYTTISEDEVLDTLPHVMEGAYTMYRQVAPDVPESKRPMECYIFRWRSEWEAYTERHAGADAAIYRQIRSGGYTMQDRYVAYYIGRNGTFSVAAHEGWHQYAGRFFKGRLPPFLEEGMACMFETISWRGQLPRFNLSVNAPRAQTLRKATEEKILWPLDKLCSMHAGDIVGESNDRIDTFYAQSWAFARFLWEGQDGAYRPALQKWLTETSLGTVWDPTHSHSRSYAPWNRRAVRPMIEHYLDKPIDQVDTEFQKYMKQIAYEELGAQWRS